MPGASQHGYLLLADVSGHASFLAGAELEQAHEILTDLLETILRPLKSVLMIAKLEGDAVFADAPESSVRRGEGFGIDREFTTLTQLWRGAPRHNFSPAVAAAS